MNNALFIATWTASIIGWTMMILGGLYLFVHAADWLFMQTLDRGLRFFDVRREFLAFAIPRIRARAIAKRKKRGAG